MNSIGCSGWTILGYVINVYTAILFVYAILSWFPNARGRWVYYLARLVEPVIAPVRRVIPPMGGLDIAFLVVILVLQFLVRPFVAHMSFGACYGIY